MRCARGDQRQAEQTTKLLDGSGQRLTLAIEVAHALRKGGPTVEDVVGEHIELLNRVGEDTRSGYRYRARDHITPTSAPYRSRRSRGTR